MVEEKVAVMKRCSRIMLDNTVVQRVATAEILVEDWRRLTREGKDEELMRAIEENLRRLGFIERCP